MFVYVDMLYSYDLWELLGINHSNFCSGHCLVRYISRLGFSFRMIFMRRRLLAQSQIYNAVQSFKGGIYRYVVVHALSYRCASGRLFHFLFILSYTWYVINSLYVYVLTYVPFEIHFQTDTHIHTIFNNQSQPNHIFFLHITKSTLLF